MRYINSLFFLVLLLLGSFSISLSQGFQNHNWYFGSSGSGLMFSKNTGNPVITPITAMNLGGTATASDPLTGTVLFYTNGSRVYESTHELMLNGTGLNANTNGNQPLAICQIPGTTDQYYIFTNDADFNAAGTIEYTIVDMGAAGNSIFPAPAVGAVDVTNRNVATGIVNSSESMIVVPNAAQDGFWLITHANGSTDYIVLPINSDGTVGVPVTTNIGTITLASHLAYNAASGRIATAPQNQNEDVEYLDFDAASGALSNATSIASTGNADFATEAIYDVEWSISGDRLYISRHGGAGTVANLMQYDVANATGPVNVLGTSVARSYGLQMAPDNNLYHLYQATSGGPYLLGQVIEPDSLTTNPAFGYASALLNSANAQAQQFTAFLPPYDPGLTLSFSPTSACLNNGITFTPFLVNTATNDTVNIDQAFWDFGDGVGASNSIIPIYTYTDNSNLNPTVNLLASSGGQIYGASSPITLTDFQLQINMTSDTTFCPNEFPPPTGTDGTASVVAQISGSTTSISWFGPNGQLPETSNTLVPDSAGYYYVVATDGSGCTAYAGVNVREYGLAEQRANIWYFGQNAGIDFNNGATPLNDSNMNTIEGCAAISDRNGQIVLYTDGVNVYDRNHTQITTNIGGEQDATQSAIIVPFINDETKYFIFTTEEVYGSYTYELKYSVFDLKENGGDGAVIDDDNLIFSPSTERVTASPNWLLAHEYGNNTFRAYPLTTNGIGQPVYSNIGSDHFFSNSEYAQGYMELGVNDRLITAVSNGAAENFIEIFDFDPQTGILSNYRQIDLTADGAIGQVYGIEASSGGNKLFASVTNGLASQMFEYYFDFQDDPVFVQRVDNLPEIGAIQTGPDGQVYVAMNNLGTLGTITPNEDTLQNSIIDPTISTFALSGGTTSTLGLPNFIQNLSNPPTQPSMTVMNGCGGDPLNFSATGTSTIDEFQWNIIQNNTVVASSSNQNPTFTNLTTPGTYTANLFIFNRCPNSPDATLTMDFEIYPSPSASTQNVQDVTGACGNSNGSFDINVSSSVPFSYSVIGPVNSAGVNLNGPTTIIVTGLSAGTYTIFITETVNGCSTSITQAISDPLPWTSSISTTNSDCTGIDGSLVVELSGTLPTSVDYTVINQNTGVFVASSGSTPIDINTTNPFTINGIPAGTYTLQLLDDVSCSEFTTDHVVSTPPQATLTMPTQASACGTNSVDVSITTDASSLSIDPATGVTFDGTTSTLTFALPGNYTVTALGDNSTLCDISQDISIIFNDVTPSPFAGQYIICPDDPLPSASQVTLSAGSDFVTVNWYDDNNNPLISGSAYTIAGDSITIFEPGIVVAELTNAFLCVTMDTIQIVEDCQPRIVAPNAFRPNSTSTDNQAFSVYTLFVQEDEFQIFIFSRWGEIVYESNDVNFAWNGGMNNQLDQQLPVGTYAYVIKYVSEYEPEKGVQEQRGGVLLIR